MSAARPWAAYRAIHVPPGECKISADPAVVISTLLGSCVAACLFDPEVGIGGLNHFLLPDGDHTAHYGTHAMELLVNGIINQGGRRRSMAAKVFGGAQMRGASVLEVGRRNIVFVRHYLRNENFPVAAEDLGGTEARRVWLHPASGRVWLERLKPAEAQPLAQAETSYRTSVNRPTDGGDIDIFS